MKDKSQAPESSLLQLLRQQQQANEGLQIKDIKQAILIAGFIADTKFIDFVEWTSNPQEKIKKFALCL